MFTSRNLRGSSLAAMLNPPFRSVDYSSSTAVTTVSSLLIRAWNFVPSPAEDYPCTDAGIGKWMRETVAAEQERAVLAAQITEAKATLAIELETESQNVVREVNEEAGREAGGIAAEVTDLTVGGLAQEEVELDNTGDSETEYITPWRLAVLKMWNHVFYDVMEFLPQVGMGIGHFHVPNHRYLIVYFTESGSVSIADTRAAQTKGAGGEGEGDRKVETGNEGTAALTEKWDTNILFVPAYVAPGVTVKGIMDTKYYDLVQAEPNYAVSNTNIGLLEASEIITPHHDETQIPAPTEATKLEPTQNPDAESVSKAVEGSAKEDEDKEEEIASLTSATRNTCWWLRQNTPVTFHISTSTLTTTTAPKASTSSNTRTGKVAAVLCIAILCSDVHETENNQDEDEDDDQGNEHEHEHNHECGHYHEHDHHEGHDGHHQHEEGHHEEEGRQEAGDEHDHEDGHEHKDGEEGTPNSEDEAGEELEADKDGEDEEEETKQGGDEPDEDEDDDDEAESNDEDDDDEDGVEETEDGKIHHIRLVDEHQHQEVLAVAEIY